MMSCKPFIPTELDRKIGHAIRILHLERGKSQKELADAVGDKTPRPQRGDRAVA